MAKNLVNSNNIEVVTSGDDLSLDFSTTAKQKIEQIEINKNDIANLKGKILWTNPNTTEEFHAQNITLSSSDYDTLEWYFRVARDKEYVMVTKTIKGWGGKIINYNDDNSLRYRYINRNNDISYGITSLGFDGSLIPMYVIGYKTGLFS